MSDTGLSYECNQCDASHYERILNSIETNKEKISLVVMPVKQISKFQENKKDSNLVFRVNYEVLTI